MANTIQDKLAYLEETKGLIREAIIAKGGTVSDEDTFRSYANKIEAIQSGGGSIAEAPPGIKFSNSTFTTVPTEIIPYIEQQTDMSMMFYNCRSLTTVASFDASKCTNMERTFAYCRSLTSVSKFDTSSVTSMDSMFENCESLTLVPLFETSSVNSMSSMFAYCSSLKTVPLFETSSLNSMSYMFLNCSSLKTVPQFDTSSVNDMSATFGNCSSLTTVPLFNTSKIDYMNSTFNGCRSLTSLGGFTGLKTSLYLSSSSKLTVESVMNVINNAADMTSSPKTLTLHGNVFNKLSQEQIATASAKGWNIAAA